MKTTRYLLMLCLAFAPTAQAGNITLKIGQQAFTAEIADTPEKRERGLMHRQRLCANCGMLFIFPAAKRHGFWMKNTPLPLSVAFIASDDRIINTTEMQPYTTEIHYAEGDALYGLEMNSGWFAAHNIKSGDLVSGIPSPATGRQAR